MFLTPEVYNKTTYKGGTPDPTSSPRHCCIMMTSQASAYRWVEQAQLYWSSPATLLQLFFLSWKWCTCFQSSLWNFLPFICWNVWVPLNLYSFQCLKLPNLHEESLSCSDQQFRGSLSSSELVSLSFSLFKPLSFCLDFRCRSCHWLLSKPACWSDSSSLCGSLSICWVMITPACILSRLLFFLFL